MRSPTSFRRAPTAAALGVGLLLAARFALGVSYSLVVPPWESYDEPGHFQYARYIAVTGHLLDPSDPEAERIWSRFQPPLYYLVVAPALSLFDIRSGVVEPKVNPYFYTGIAGLNYAVEPAVHDPLVEATHNALLMGRLLGVLISTVSAVFVYGAARRLWPDQRRLHFAAALVYAFWPQAVFLGSVMTNDLLITSLAAVLTYLVVKVRQDGLTIASAGLISIVVAAAILTKLNGVAFLVPAGLVIAWSLRLPQTRGLSLTLVVSALMGLSALAMLALTRFKFITEQVLQVATFERFLRHLQEPWLTPAHIAFVLNYGRQTFIASFGWGNVEAWGFVHVFWTLFAVLGGLGMVAILLDRRAGPGVRSSLVIFSSLFVTLVGLSLALMIAQNDPYLVVGRYFLPALPGLALVLTSGFSRWLPARNRGALLSLGAATQLLMAWMIPFDILAHVYARPQPATGQELALIDTRYGAVYEPGMRLLGASFAEADGPERPLNVTICWQADRTIERDYPLRLNLIGPNGQGYGHYVTYPGQGNYATSLWVVGQSFCDDFLLPVRGDYPAPAEGRLEVAFLEGPNDLREISAATVDGMPLATSPTVPIVVHGQAQTPVAPPAVPLDLRFGSAIALEGYSVQTGDDRQSLALTLYWRCLEPVSEDLSVFAHLRTNPTTVYAQDDSRPREDHYPTNLWRPGELILDVRDFVVDLDQAPPLTLYLGLYTEAGRIPASAAGTPLPADEFSAPLWPIR